MGRLAIARANGLLLLGTEAQIRQGKAAQEAMAATDPLIRSVCYAQAAGYADAAATLLQAEGRDAAAMRQLAEVYMRKAEGGMG